MNSVAIFMEGGGKGKGSRSALRIGMDEFLRELKDEARARSWRWSLSCEGSRNEAFDAFGEACRRRKHTVIVLLVDAEEPVVRRMSPRRHLSWRDSWDMDEFDDDAVHLMVQTMETWIVADPEALADYYGQGFRANALPARPDLEDEAKAAVADALKRATSETPKGRYRKIRHASDLLRLIDPRKARKRCRHCERLFDALGRALAPAP